jgi:hypothetical protein
VSGQEKFRVFRRENGVPVYVGNFEGPTSKDASRTTLQVARGEGEEVYEAHVLRSAGVFETRARLEQSIDSVTPLNTQQFFSD